MTNTTALKEFTNQEFGTIRIVMLDGTPWFVGKDVVQILGYESPRSAVSKKVDAEDRGVAEMETPSGKQQMTVINESCLYSLILSSKLPSAKKFKKWVTGEVLPSIREHGAYMTPDVLEKVLLNPDTIINIAQKLKEEMNLRREAEEKLDRTRQKNTELQTINDILTDKTREWSNKATVNAMIRKLANQCYCNSFSAAFRVFYKELRYKEGVNLKNRTCKSKTLIDRIQDDEWGKVFKVALCMCERSGIDVVKVINEVNMNRIRELIEEDNANK